MTGMGFRIENLWAYIAVHGDGDEGLPAFAGVGGIWTPMVGADKDRIDSLRPTAEAMSRIQPIVLAKFGPRIELERFG